MNNVPCSPDGQGLLWAMVLGAKLELKVAHKALTKKSGVIDDLLASRDVKVTDVRVVDRALASWSFERRWLLGLTGTGRVFRLICSSRGADPEAEIEEVRDMLSLPWNGTLLRRRIEEWRSEGGTRRNQIGRSGKRAEGVGGQGGETLAGVS